MNLLNIFKLTPFLATSIVRATASSSNTNINLNTFEHADGDLPPFEGWIGPTTVKNLNLLRYVNCLESFGADISELGYWVENDVVYFNKSIEDIVGSFGHALHDCNELINDFAVTSDYITFFSGEITNAHDLEDSRTNDTVIHSNMLKRLDNGLKW